MEHFTDTEQDEDPLHLEALLDFEPVPRQRAVEGGWTPEKQREFITRLAVHGSATKACDEMGKNQTGVMKLYRSPLGASFRAAWDGAVALARRRRAEREAALAPVSPGIKPPTVDHRRKHGRFACSARKAGGESGQEEPIGEGPDFADEGDEHDAENGRQWFDTILAKYWHKVVAERKARLNGEIVAADFYLRQMTWIEVSIDVASGGNGIEQLERLRLDSCDLTEIAETPFSRLIDDMRRHIWRQMGEPERPEHPPRHLLVEHDGYSTEPTESTRGGIALSHEEQQAVFKQRHIEAAEEQARWEAKAYRDYEQRRAREASSAAND